MVFDLCIGGCQLSGILGYSSCLRVGLTSAAVPPHRLTRARSVSSATFMQWWGQAPNGDVLMLGLFPQRRTFVPTSCLGGKSWAGGAKGADGRRDFCIQTPSLFSASLLIAAQSRARFPEDTAISACLESKNPSSAPWRLVAKLPVCTVTIRTAWYVQFCGSWGAHCFPPSLVSGRATSSRAFVNVAYWLPPPCP